MKKFSGISLLFIEGGISSFRKAIVENIVLGDEGKKSLFLNKSADLPKGLNDLLGK